MGVTNKAVEANEVQRFISPDKVGVIVSYSHCVDPIIVLQILRGNPREDEPCRVGFKIVAVPAVMSINRNARVYKQLT